MHVYKGGALFLNTEWSLVSEGIGDALQVHLL